MKASRPAGLVVVALIAIILALGAVEAAHLVGNARYGSLSAVCRVQTTSKVVALSFDDGPDPVYTPMVLDMLRKNGAAATFFLIGLRVEAEPDLVSEEVRAGMEVANHTWSHPHLPTLSIAQTAAEIGRTSSAIEDIGAPSDLFRAPFGDARVDQLSTVLQLGLEPIHWSIPLDHYVGELGLSPQEAADDISDDIRPGDIILAHDAGITKVGEGRNPAMATIRLLLPNLKARGYAITTVGGLLEYGTPIRATPRPWFWQNGFTCGRP